MRQIKDKANNNQALNEVVDYGDLTPEEKDMLIIPFGRSIEDYANFRVRHNKQGELLSVRGNDLSDTKADDIQRKADQPNIVDLYVAYGDSETPISRSDRRGARLKFEKNGTAEKAESLVKRWGGGNNAK